ncbi:leukocyte-associated immunoglobulin-like receptor 1 isoform X2 [Saccopteryx bilineata]|uniref:leukocyte-associated immunoglobulin-like receptor 1 isoform X2 n=1 Tax=Saccopteryx bilineata TaxID=59482 RepID=UPI00338F1567
MGEGLESPSPWGKDVDVATLRRATDQHILCPVPAAVLPPTGSRTAQAEGLAMSPRPTTLLGLVLCLGHTIHMQEGAPPTPSIRADPRSVIPRGQPVTIVCQGPAGVDKFRLEKKENVSDYKDQGNISQLESQKTEARFCIPAVTEDTAGPYRCLYHLRKTGNWSLHSEPLELKVTGLETVYVYIIVGVSVACLLCLLLLVLLLVRRQHQKKHGFPHSKGEEQRPQERLSPVVDITESTPDVATGDELPEKNKETHSPSPAAGDAQEVTYAQLDKRTLTLGPAQAVSPQSPEPTADSSMYAALARR